MVKKEIRKKLRSSRKIGGQNWLISISDRPTAPRCVSYNSRGRKRLSRWQKKGWKVLRQSIQRKQLNEDLQVRKSTLKLHTMDECAVNRSSQISVSNFINTPILCKKSSFSSNDIVSYHNYRISRHIPLFKPCTAEKVALFPMQVITAQFRVKVRLNASMGTRKWV